ncbi:MAG: hypothetical protein JST00_43690 [Deltaproteobacteria bacterium]|nr:hypothetical protein [Deltaproteobacteria bacterium]
MGDGGLRPPQDSGALDGAHASPYEGWDHYADYDPACEFYVPSSRATMPPPIRWQPCRAFAETQGLACTEMVQDWKPSKLLPNELIAPGTRGVRLKDGRIGVLSARFQEDGVFRFVSALDGPLLVAIREARSTHCTLGADRSHDGYYVFHVFDSEATGSVSEKGGGAIGGSIDDLRPTVLRRYHDSRYRDYAVGEPGVIDITGGPMRLTPWSNLGGAGEMIGAPEDGALLYNYQFFFKDALFWAADGSGINKQKVWTRGSGVKDFLSFGNETTKGIADLGTDGVDMAWLEASGRAGASGVFPDVAVYTSKFTTDPSKIQKRLLRSDQTGYSFGVAPFVVGCGYAARSTFRKTAGEPAGATMLVRLSDGAAWFLPTVQTSDWSWLRPLGVTCDELVVVVNTKPSASMPSSTTVARVRIDSLGPPTPP